MSSQGNTRKVLKGCRDEDLTYNSYEDLIEILQNDSEISKKLSCIDVVFKKFVKPPNGGPLQSKILQEVMPYAKELIDSVFEKTVELSLDNQHEKCISTLEIIRENLDMVIELLDILDNLLSFVISKNKVNFSSIENLPMCIGNILYTTFLHCKESNNIYLIYFDSISEILLIFKKAQEVHVKLLRTLESHVLVNISNPKELSLLKEVLDILLNIGILLPGMNVKSMADNWKGYTNLTQKYNDPLAKDIDLRRPLELLTNEILANLKGTFVMDMEDVKTVTYTLKIGNFIIKVMLKLCFTFWNNVRSNFDVLWTFLISLYSHSIQSSKQIKSPDLIKSYVVDPLDPLIQRLSTEEKFCQLGEIKPESPLCSYGYLSFMNRVFYHWICTLSDSPVDRYQLDVHLRNIICCFKENHLSILDDEDYYKGLIVHLPLLALKLNDTNFYAFEEMLCKHFFNDSIFVSIFIQDIWLSFMRLNSPSYAYNVLCNLVDKSKFAINSKFSNDVPIRKLSSLLRNVFSHLSNDYKAKFLLQHPIDKNLSLWKRLGIDELPKSARQDIEALLIDTVQHVEKFLAGKCSLEQFFVMVDLLLVISTLRLEQSYFDLSKLSLLVFRLWTFEFSEELMDSPFFDLLLEGVLKITCSLTWKFSNEQLIQILDTLKSVTKSNDTSRILCVSFFGNKVEQIGNTVRSENTNDLLKNIGEITHNLLSTNNVVLKNEAFRLIKQYLKRPLKDTITQYIVKKTPKYSGFLTSTFGHDPVDTARIGNVLKLPSYVPSHKCLEWSYEPKMKKIKIDEKGEINKMLSKLEEDVDNLKELVKREDLKAEHVATISTIISTLHLCLK